MESSSARGMYIRSTSDIPPKRKDIGTSSDMNELSEIAKKKVKSSEIPPNPNFYGIKEV